MSSSVYSLQEGTLVLEEEATASETLYIYDKDVRGSSYQVGDIVSLHDPVVKRGCLKKLHGPWKGHFKVVKILSPTVYCIQDCKSSRKRKVMHFNHLKPAHCGNNAPASALLSSENTTNSSETTMSTSPENDFDGDDPDYIVYLPSRKEPPLQQVEL